MFHQNVTYLSQREVKLIAKIWNSVTNKTTFGENVLLQVFMYRPNLKSLFKFRKVPVGSLHRDPRFLFQATKIVHFMDATIKDLLESDEKSIIDRSLHVGHRHAQLTTVQFDRNWWQIFSSAILDCIAPKCVKNSKTALIAWHTLLDHVTEIMSFGFYAHAPSIRTRQILPTIFEYEEFLADREHLIDKGKTSFLKEWNNHVAALSDGKSRRAETDNNEKTLCFPWKFPSPRRQRRQVPQTDPLPRKNVFQENLKLRSLEDWDAVWLKWHV